MKTKTMKTMHCLVAGLRPANSFLARRFALAAVSRCGADARHPCAGAPFNLRKPGPSHGPPASRRCCPTAGSSSLAATPDPFDALKSAELYNPATGTWTAGGNLVTARFSHTATLLRGGKVLIAGGFNGGWLASAEIYDPASGRWTATGSLASARNSNTATLLPNGKVLVAGGLDSGSSVLASAELYDPASGTWTTTGSLATARAVHTATLLSDGTVLVVGGDRQQSAPSRAAELYDPANRHLDGHR